MIQGKDFLGKKIVFVYPPEVVQGELLSVLYNEELEAYTLQDHRKIPDIVEKHPDTLFFLNIDTVLNDLEWQKLVEDLQKRYPHIMLGILTFKIDKDLHELYLMELGVKCGYIQLKLGLQKAKDMMIKILEANEVRGRRQYLRYQCSENCQASLNFKMSDDLLTGNILDISSVAMSCHLSAHQGLAKNQLISRMQMRLKGAIVITDAVLVGSRIVQDEQTIYVFLFKTDTPEKIRPKIRTFISQNLQMNFNREFNLSGQV